ncbi:preprotein translocase subunit SecY [Amycolatopsis lurida]|uniref:Preprotein translocase subunit SecY n=1 Tax=Amycolatopsis lurida NRRL 2430 TaxID=1460371 RepID=A0A2P2FTJ9_AMYLU|nr:preprotein translocase subunit SecY [Amycolatopsis lurida]KFU80040.1 preprotein translocase subunit SecY [Amycolatopsis lurida NRRL 2430]SEC83322.1 preprotein translocase subunit SecY [Amycolatopsis lurida]
MNERASLRRRILVTLGVIVLFRLGQTLPTPHVTVRAPEAEHPLRWILDLLTGGGLATLPVFAFGVLPCLAAPRLLRGLIVLIPRLAALRAEGEAGARVLKRYQRRLVVVLGQVGAVGVLVFRGQDVLEGQGAVAVACLTAGTALVLRLTEVITDRGFGDGVRILLLAQVLAVLPAEFLRLYERTGWAAIAVMTVVTLSITVLTIVIAQGQRRVPVQYAKRMIGRRAFGGTPTYVPLRFPQANSPAVVAAVLLSVLVHYLGLADPGWIAVYFVLVCLFAFMRAAAAQDMAKVAGELVRVGGFVPGIRPGNWTAEYLDSVNRRVLAFGALCSGVVALIPVAGLALLDGGPTLLVSGVTLQVVLVFLVSVSLDTTRQIESLRRQRRYEPFLR